jgi:uncharacterized lipoprotein YajG
MIKRHTTAGLMLAASAILLAGCEANTKVAVRQPAATPAPQAAPLDVREALPLHDNSINYLSLRVDTRPAIDILVQQVQDDLTAGQQDFRTGNADKGRADLDRAVNRILVSGFQAESDPRLSKLFDQIGETLHSYQVASGRVIRGWC